MTDTLFRALPLSVDEIINLEGKVPKEIKIEIEDKTTTEQMRLIAELDEKDKNIVFGMIETMLTKKKFKDFFNNNIAAL
ncbi:MAG: transcriptional regulator [Bacteroidia bacterium]